MKKQKLVKEFIEKIKQIKKDLNKEDHRIEKEINELNELSEIFYPPQNNYEKLRKELALSSIRSRKWGEVLGWNNALDKVIDLLKSEIEKENKTK